MILPRAAWCGPTPYRSLFALEPCNNSLGTSLGEEIAHRRENLPPQLTRKHLLAYYRCMADAPASDANKVFKALADASRRQLLDLLHADNGQTLASLCAHIAMTRQAVTQHLNLLEDANLVVVVWQGREKLHYINPVPLHAIYTRWVQKFETNQLDILHNLKTQLEGKDDEET